MKLAREIDSAFEVISSVARRLFGCASSLSVAAGDYALQDEGL